MPTIHSERSYVFHFRAGEVLEEPPHIHVEGEKGNMKVWIPSLEVAYSDLPNSEEKKILRIVKLHIEKIMEVWWDCENKTK